MVKTVNTEPRILHLLLLILCGAGPVLCADNILKKVGSDYAFRPTITGKPDSILWKLNNDKVVEFEDGTTKWFQFDNQGALNNATGVLTLKGLNKGNSGKYEAEIMVAGKLQQTTFTLKVKDGVGVPTISCIVAADGQITLTCSADDSVGPVEYNWSGPEGKLKGKTINSSATNPESVYFCTANNEVDNQSKSFSRKECNIPGPLSVGGIVACVFGAIIGIALIVAASCWKKIRKYIPVSTK